ncbi:MAG TPA: NUDIX hydrolase [Micropepsaceae bacterium]|nr:NUDIX hydrolase [Micropepsaceae bacterium]
MSRTASRLPVSQYGALPWRRTPDGLEILLITTRNTRRWIVPKGWPEAGRTAQQCAAQEAFEEAGVTGAVAEHPVGMFSYKKQLKSGQIVTCRIRIYPLEVNEIAGDWPEKSARETKWCEISEALVLVEDPGLKRIIAKFFRAAAALHHAA